MKAKIRHSLLAAALALAAVPAAVQASDSPFTQTIFFGDSLTDGGYFRPVLAGVVGPTNAAVIGQFTNNPGYVWSQYLADYYDSNADVAWKATGATITTLLEAEDLAQRRVAVEVNGEIVPRGRHAEHRLHDGDKVEIVHALGGG